MIRTLLASAFAACALGACADLGYYEDASGYGNRYEGEVYYSRGSDGYRRERDRDYDRDYDRRRDRDRDRDYDRDRDRDGRGRDRDRDGGRDKQRMTIEDAQYESVNGKRVDAKNYVRGECQGENNCDVKASNKKFGDPDVGAHKDLIVRYRCGKGPTRTVRVPEKSEEDIKC